MSYARVDFVHEEDSSQPTRRFRATRSAAPTPPEPPASFFPSLRLCLRNLVGKHTQLPLVEHGRIHHANQNLFDRTVTEPIDDALDRFRRKPFTHGLGRYRTVGPNQLHYLSFEVTQCGQAIVHYLLPCDVCPAVTLQSVAHVATIRNDDSI